MTSITDIIAPITLLHGSHEDTAKTGQGCFMNVISYLNGEPQITDNSPCVCVTVRKIAIWFNDFLRPNERQQMIPFIERAMGSATTDRDVMNKRLALTVVFARKQSEIAANDAAYANNAAYAAKREQIKAVTFEYLNAVLPRRDFADAATIARANQLVAIAA